jgi:hypothetical protein
MFPKLEIPKLKFHGHALERPPPPKVGTPILFYFWKGKGTQSFPPWNPCGVGWDVIKNLIPCPRKNRILLQGGQKHPHWGPLPTNSQDILLATDPSISLRSG